MTVLYIPHQTNDSKILNFFWNWNLTKLCSPITWTIFHESFINRFMMTSSNGNIFRVTGHLCGGIHRSPVNSPHEGQWRWALMFSLVCVWINGWVNNREAGDLRCYRTHYDVIVMFSTVWSPRCGCCGWSSTVITLHHVLHVISIHAVQSTAPHGLFTHWGQVMYICVGKLTNNGSDNGLSPGRRQAIIWTKAGISLIGPLGTNFSEILIRIQTFSFRKMYLKMSFAKWHTFCLGLNELNWFVLLYEHDVSAVLRASWIVWVSFIFRLSARYEIGNETHISGCNMSI